MHKYGFGQAHCRDLLKRSPRKFILYFSDFSTNLSEFLKLIEFLKY
jgi:hypothetical protein